MDELAKTLKDIEEMKGKPVAQEVLDIARDSELSEAEKKLRIMDKFDEVFSEVFEEMKAAYSRRRFTEE